MKNVCALAFAALIACTLPRPAGALPYSGLVVLGDSLSDQGNLLKATTDIGPTLIPPQPGQPSSQYFAGRFSNGPVYTDVLASNLGVSLTPSLLGGTNFAFGGARTDYNTVEVPPFGTQVFPRGAAPWSLNAQVQAFQTYAGTHSADPNALYVVFSGSNDVTDIIARGKPANATIAITVAGVINAIDVFKAAGARTVLVPNLPDIGVTPRVTSLEGAHPGISHAATTLIAAYNNALATALNNESGIQIIRFDTFAFLDAVVADPAEFGFTNSTQPCFSGFVAFDPAATTCANPSDYVFWDSEHPTTAFHTLLGDALFASAVPEPATAALVGCGLVALAGGSWRRRSVKRSP